MRPRTGNDTRATTRGVGSLDTPELLALCLSERRDRSQWAASELLRAFDFSRLSRADEAEIQRAAGIGPEEAARLAAAFELGRRVETARPPAPRPILRSPASVHTLMRFELRGLDRETFHALLLDSKHRLQRRCRVSEGTLNTSLVHPREVYRPAIQAGSAAIIVVHNHPSGDPEPSAEDLAVTRRLVEAGRLLGVPLLDHVVIGDGSFASIRERISFEGG